MDYISPTPTIDTPFQLGETTLVSTHRLSILKKVTFNGHILGKSLPGMLPGLHEHSAIMLGRYLMQYLTCRDSRVKQVRYDGTPGIVDLFFYMHHDSPAVSSNAPTTVSTRLFATHDTGSTPSLNWSIGIDMVYVHPWSCQCRVAWIDSSIKPVRLEYVPISYNLIIVEEHELEPFPWPVDIDSVAMARSLNLPFIWSRAKFS
jgi:hypothetical protein